MITNEAVVATSIIAGPARVMNAITDWIKILIHWSVRRARLSSLKYAIRIFYKNIMRIHLVDSFPFKGIN